MRMSCGRITKDPVGSQGRRAALVTACYQRSGAKCPEGSTLPPVARVLSNRAATRTCRTLAVARQSSQRTIRHERAKPEVVWGAQGRIVRGPRGRGCREAQRHQQHAPASAHGLGQGLRGHLYLRRLPARLLWPRVSDTVHIPALRKALADKLGASGAPGMTRL